MIRINLLTSRVKAAKPRKARASKLKPVFPTEPARGKPEGCRGCPLAALGRGFVRASECKSPVLLVQGEAPGATEVAEGAPFVGRAGWWVRHNLLEVAGVDPDRVVFDNTLRCLPPVKGDSDLPAGFPTLALPYPPASIRDACEARCRQYDVWEQHPGVPLLLVGGNAARQRIGAEPITKWHGHIEARDGRFVGATFHPSAVMRNPNLLPVVVQEIKNLVRTARRGSTLVSPPTAMTGPTGWPESGPFVCDLEWGADHAVTVVGVAGSADRAHSTWGVERGLEWVRDAINEGRQIIGHNIIDADLPLIGAKPRSYRAEHVFDTMIAAHLVHPHLAGAAGTADAKDTGVGLLGLGDLVRMYFGVPNWKHDTTDLLHYNGLDCAYNFRLAESLKQDLRQTAQEHLVEKQQQLAVVTHAMHERGIALDSAAAREAVARQEAMRAEMRALLPFNPQSPKQVTAWFGERGVLLKDTSAETLERAARQHPELSAVFEPLCALKGDWKSISTWFPRDAVEAGWIAPHFHPTGTAVARFSSSGPNFQNLPPALRRLIVPRDLEAVLLAFDYSQIENRIVAWLAGAKSALADFASGLDVHRLAASRIFAKRPEDVTPDERQVGKTVVHATGYLERKYNLAQRLWGSRSRENVERADALQRGYFAAYPEIAQWHGRLKAQLRSGRIQFRNPFGRWRCVYAQNLHEQAKRAAHFLGCSTAADLINERLLVVRDELDLVPLLVVHDELVFEIARGDVEKTAPRIAEIMQAPASQLGGMCIPVVASVGRNYGKQSEANPDGLAKLN